MRIAYYQDGSVAQVVLTPEDEVEKAMLLLLRDGSTLQVKMGGFYECVGGYFLPDPQPSSSRILVIRPPEPDPPSATFDLGSAEPPPRLTGDPVRGEVIP